MGQEEWYIWDTRDPKIPIADRTGWTRTAANPFGSEREAREYKRFVYDIPIYPIGRLVVVRWDDIPEEIRVNFILQQVE